MSSARNFVFGGEPSLAAVYARRVRIERGFVVYCEGYCFSSPPTLTLHWPRIIVGTDSDKATILAVEDNADTLTLLRYMLTKTYRPLLASDKDEALSLAGEHAIDLFLLDINLGQEYTGINLMKQLRDDPRHADTPILALTAYAMPGDRERFVEMGFDGYVSKPFTKEALLETIRGVLRDWDATP